MVFMFSGADELFFFHVAAIELETEVRVLHLTQENAAESGGAQRYVPQGCHWGWGCFGGGSVQRCKYGRIGLHPHARHDWPCLKFRPFRDSE